MQTVLVTGAAGALGQAVLARLENTNRYRVVTAGRAAGDGDGHVTLDLRNGAQVEATLARIQPDLVLHLAASFTGDFDEAYAINVAASRCMLDAIEKSAKPARLLLVGSAAEYGVVQPADNPVREDRVLGPVTVYGLTKAWQTQLAGMYAQRGVDVVVARVFNLDGPGVAERLFVGRLQKQIGEVVSGARREIEMGSLSATRDYLSTDDAAKQIMVIARHGESGKVYHVASGEPVTMRALLARHLAANKLDFSIVRESVNTSTHSGYDVPVIYADVSRTMELMKREACGQD